MKLHVQYFSGTNSVFNVRQEFFLCMRSCQSGVNREIAKFDPKWESLSFVSIYFCNDVADLLDLVFFAF